MVFYWRVETYKRLFIIIIIIIIQPLILRSNSWPRTNSTMVRTSASSLWGGKPFSKACIEINQSIILVVYYFFHLNGRKDCAEFGIHYDSVWFDDSRKKEKITVDPAYLVVRGLTR